MDIKKEKSRTMYFECDCHGEALKITKWAYDEKKPDEYLAFLSHFIGSWDAVNKPFLRKLKRSLRIIWKVIRGQEYYFYEVIFTKAEWEKFKKFVNEE